MKVLDSVKIADDLIRSYWHPIGHKSELACDRDFIRFEIKDFEVVVINDKVISLHLTICAHTGGHVFLQKILATSLLSVSITAGVIHAER